MRLPLLVFQRLLDQITRRLQQDHLDDGRCLGHRTFLIDGTSFSMPDEEVLQSAFGQPGAQQPGIGFPVAHLLALFHSGSGMILKVLMAPMRTHDMSRATLVHPELRVGDVLVGDSAFCSYTHLALLLQRGVQGLMKIHHRMIVDFTPGRDFVSPTQGKNQMKGMPRFRQIRCLGKSDQIVQWFKQRDAPVWITQEQYDALPDSIRVRELRYQVEARGFRVREVTLVTTLLNHQAYTSESLSELYFARWQVEVNLGHLKTTMGMSVLKSQTVDGVLKEMIIYVIIYNLVRLVMLEAAYRQQVEFNRISFVDALRWLQNAQPTEPICELIVLTYRPFRFRTSRRETKTNTTQTHAKAQKNTLYVIERKQLTP